MFCCLSFHNTKRLGWIATTWWLLRVVVVASCSSGLVVVVAAQTPKPPALLHHTKPIRVFVLAGQSNMVGMGSMEHLDLLIHDNSTCCNPYRRDLWNGTHYKQRDDVYIKFDDRQGPLTVGYGVDGHRFGPELMFGWVLGNHYASASEPIYLIKTAWGGQDLAVDFRPPKSGEGNYSDVRPSFYGHRFRDMATGVQEGLDAMTSIIPNYNATIGYQLAGFVWFQGWNDMLDMSKVQEYAYNLANFIRDVSAEWQLPNLPVIVGELGMHGVNYTGHGADRVNGMRQAEREVPALPEFRSRALFVPTSPYAVLNGTSYNGDYHYYGRADTFYHMGKAMGQGMLKLLEKQKKRNQLRGSNSFAASFG